MKNWRTFSVRCARWFVHPALYAVLALRHVEEPVCAGCYVLLGLIIVVEALTISERP